MAAPEVEDGEILDSEEEIFHQPDCQPFEKVSKDSIPSRSITTYRDTVTTTRHSSEDSSDDDSNEDESDDDIPSKKRRPGRNFAASMNKVSFDKTAAVNFRFGNSAGKGQQQSSGQQRSGVTTESGAFGRGAPAASSTPLQPAVTQGKSKPKKNYNIWSSVVQDQNQEAVERKLVDGFDIESSFGGRDVESYSISEPRHLPMMAQALAAVSTPPEGSTVQGPREAISYTDEGIEIDNRVSVKERVGEPDTSSRKRKRTKKKVEERLIYLRNTKATASDPPHVVATEIAEILGEEKVHLIHRVVKTIGAESALKVLSQTKNVEESGGLMIKNGTRKRTPGGVFLYLLRTHPGISEEQLKEMLDDKNSWGNRQRRKEMKEKNEEVKMETTVL